MNEKTIQLPIFGQITLTETNWEYKFTYNIREYNFNGNPIDLDVNFIEVTDDNIKLVSKALNDLDQLNRLGVEGFTKDFASNGETQKYIYEWNEDIFEQIFTETEFEDFIKDTNSNVAIEERILQKLRLVRAGIYAGTSEYFVILDYAFGYDIDKGFRDNMLIVKLDKNYNVCEIANEG